MDKKMRQIYYVIKVLFKNKNVILTSLVLGLILALLDVFLFKTFLFFLVEFGIKEVFINTGLIVNFVLELFQNKDISILFMLLPLCILFNLLLVTILSSHLIILNHSFTRRRDIISDYFKKKFPETFVNMQIAVAITIFLLIAVFILFVPVNFIKMNIKTNSYINILFENFMWIITFVTNIIMIYFFRACTVVLVINKILIKNSLHKTLIEVFNIKGLTLFYIMIAMDIIFIAIQFINIMFLKWSSNYGIFNTIFEISFKGATYCLFIGIFSVYFFVEFIKIYKPNLFKYLTYNR